MSKLTILAFGILIMISYKTKKVNTVKTLITYEKVGKLTKADAG